jgi:hypothetical protein
MEVVQLKKFRRALKAQQAIAIHALGETGRLLLSRGAPMKWIKPADLRIGNLPFLDSIAGRSYFATFRQHCAALRMGPSALAPTVKRRLDGIV